MNLKMFKLVKEDLFFIPPLMSFSSFINLSFTQLFTKQPKDAVPSHNKNFLPTKKLALLIRALLCHALFLMEWNFVSHP